jgi:hypothetical protein
MIRRHYTGILAAAVAMVWCVTFGGASAETVVRQDATALNADEVPAFAQETTASLGSTGEAQIHQWGIIRLNRADAPSSGAASLLSVPEFVHQTAPAPGAEVEAWLDYSALYIHPPMMMKAPLKFDITMEVPGTVQAWYPFAAVSPGGVSWRGVLAGAQADGLDTTHPIWMAARAVASPATLKVHKPGPRGTQPDDPGTTEGDVFLFARAALARSPVSVAAEGTSLTVSVAGVATTAPLHAWIISAGDEGSPFRLLRIIAQRAIINADVGGTNWLIPLNLASNSPENLSVDDVKARFNEAFAGNGLDSDESSALVNTLLSTIRNAPGRRFLVVLPPAWAPSALPLRVTGSPAETPVRVFVTIVPLRDSHS